LNRTSRTIIQYLFEVSASGGEHPAYDGLRIFQHPDRAVLQLAGQSAQIVPLTLEMWPSLSCNARCPLCPYRMSGSRNAADSTQELFLSNNDVSADMLREFSRLGGRSVIFTGGGEPLLNPGIVALARAAVESGLHWALFTNGILLTEVLAQRLLELAPSFLRVSVDAGTADEHQRVYASDVVSFETVLDNAARAAVVAARLGSRAFGLSFTLTPRVSDEELRAIAAVIIDLQERGESGLSLVAFRPRVVHYRRGVPVSPQPFASKYQLLVSRIESLIVEPVRARCPGLRADIKRGLFRLAEGSEVRPCFSSCWTLTASEDGRLWTIPELAGSDYSWGRYGAGSDLKGLWESPTRITQLARVESGEIAVPIVHRTSPIDELVRGLRLLAPTVSLEESRLIVAETLGQNWYRSANAEFA
jgi:MoaA/NifB/PqqE/SkfB family radical SAM enzyme